MANSELRDSLSRALSSVEENDYVAALDHIQHSLSVAGETSFAYHMMGVVAVRMSEMPRALELFRKAHQMSPGIMEHAEALSILYAQTGRVTDSLYFGKLSTVLSPSPIRDILLPDWLGSFEASFAEAQKSPYYDLGMKAFHQGCLSQALMEFQREAELNPKRGDCWRMLATVLRYQKRPIEEIMVLRGLEDTGDVQPRDFARIGRALNAVRRCDEAEVAYGTAVEKASQDPDLDAMRISDLYLLPETPRQLIAAAEIRWGEKFRPLEEPEGRRTATSSVGPGKIQVGLVSSRFRLGEGLDHIWPLLLCRNHGRLELSCYSYNDYSDAMTRRIAGAVKNFQELTDVEDRTAARIIENDDIDVLIDLDAVVAPEHMKMLLEVRSAIKLRYNGLASSAAAMGYDAVFGSGYCYGQSQLGVCAVQGGFLAFPEGEQSVIGSDGTAAGLKTIGWMPSFSAVNDKALQLLKLVTRSLPDVTIRIFSNGVGGVRGVDELLPQFRDRGLRPFIEFSDVSSDRASDRDAFLDAVDLILDLGDAGPDNVLASLVSNCPVLCLPGELPMTQLGRDLILSTGKDIWVCNTSQQLVERLTSWHDDEDAWRLARQNLLAGVRLAREPGRVRDRFAAFEAAMDSAVRVVA